MCGIIGYFNVDDAASKVLAGLRCMRERGRDASGIVTDAGIQAEKDPLQLKAPDARWAMGHNLHSVVAFLPQPLKHEDSVFTANCEIYNWKELNTRHGCGASSDAELLHRLVHKRGVDVLDEMRGVFAFIYKKQNKVTIARDLLGVKPLWFSQGEHLAVASEKKALIECGFTNIEELNPRCILTYDTDTKAITLRRRRFFSIDEDAHKDQQQFAQETLDLLNDAVKTRIPDRKFGVLFSGGIDSTLIAYLLKTQGCDITCYTAALQMQGLRKGHEQAAPPEGEQEAEDLRHAKSVARELGLKLKYVEVPLDEVPARLERLVPLIEDSNVVKVGVGLTFAVACELARKDGVKVIYSGLGSEELYAGYERHKRAANVNAECLSGLRKIYERDLYRDDVITMNNNIELRLPFLDKTLAAHALTIPSRHKIDGKNTKVILRDAARLAGLSEQITQRPKRAAQYGSRFDKAIEKLARRAGFPSKSAYLRTFYPYPNVKLAALVSGGKDSLYALHLMQKQNYDISCMVTLRSENKDSYMFHTPNIALVELQAKACGIPLIMQDTKGEKEAELDDLRRALQRAKDEHHIEGVTCGAIFSQYQRERVETVCDALGLKIFTPLWHMHQELEMRNILEEGFTVLLSSVAAEGLDRSWLGRALTQADVDRLVGIDRKTGINVAGEGGEFESLVLDAPFFARRIHILGANIEMENTCTGRYIVTDAELVDK